MGMTQSVVIENRFTTIKVRDSFRKWLKVYAAQEGVPMYVAMERLVARTEKDRPWESD